MSGWVEIIDTSVYICEWVRSEGGDWEGDDSEVFYCVFKIQCAFICSRIKKGESRE
jgi:hypothetical protein